MSNKIKLLKNFSIYWVLVSKQFFQRWKFLLSVQFSHFPACRLRPVLIILLYTFVF